MGDRGHNRHGPKRRGLLCPFSGELGPRLIQCDLCWGLLPYQLVASSSIQPFGHNRHGPKIEWRWVCPFSGGSWVPIENKVAWEARPTSIPSGILVHPAVWPQQTLAENWGGSSAPLREGELGPYLTQCRVGRGLPLYQVASWSMQPFGHNRRGPKIGWLRPFWGGGWVPI